MCLEGYRVVFLTLLFSNFYPVFLVDELSSFCGCIKYGKWANYKEFYLFF